MMPINKLLLGDNVKWLNRFPNECIDLTVTSPPYNLLRNYEGLQWNFKEIAKELYRVTKTGGIVVWVIGDQVINGSESLTSFKHAIYFVEKCGFKLHDTMIYEKSTFAHPENNRCYQIFEFMLVLSKGSPKTFNKINDRIVKNVGKTHRPTRREKDGSITFLKEVTYKEVGGRTNIWRFAIGKSTSCEDNIALGHPAIFPEDLAKGHIITWSNEGDLVLDCFVGSGTTCVVAKRLNRKYIGIDISKTYLDIAKTRIKNDRKSRSKSLGGLLQ